MDIMSVKLSLFASFLSAYLLLYSPCGVGDEDTSRFGERLFVGYCASCHGSDAKGDGMVAAVFAIPIPDLTVLSAANQGVFPAKWVYETIDGRADVIAHGSRDMPVWGLEFSWEEGGGEVAEQNVRRRIQALVDYIEAIQSPALATGKGSGAGDGKSP